MGRSVITHRDATVVAYLSFQPDEEAYRDMWDDLDEDDREYYGSLEDYMYRLWNDSDAQFAWDDLKVYIQDRLTELWPSLEATDRSTGNYGYDDEQTVIAENRFAEVSISEYCGSVALSLAPRSDLEEYEEDYNKREALAKHWRNKISERFLKEFSEYEKLGTFSNGESVYQKVSA